MATKVSLDDAKQRLAELIESVRSGQDGVVFTDAGQERAVLISMEEMALLEALEDRMDLEEARRVLATESDEVAWNDLKRELGL